MTFHNQGLKLRKSLRTQRSLKVWLHSRRTGKPPPQISNPHEEYLREERQEGRYLSAGLPGQGHDREGNSHGQHAFWDGNVLSLSYFWDLERWACTLFAWLAASIRSYFGGLILCNTILLKHDCWHWFKVECDPRQRWLKKWARNRRKDFTKIKVLWS